MASVDTVFTRLLLRDVHIAVRKAFPEIRNVVKCVGVTSTMRGQWFVQISAFNERPAFSFDCRAYNATEARYKAWCAYLSKYAPEAGEVA